MMIKEIDLNKISRLASQQVDHVTCIECCKYYIVPTTATCGHSLCHACWRGRRTCPVCRKPVERKTLKLNLPLQNLTEHVHTFGDSVDKLFNIKLDEFSLDTPGEFEPEEDPSKHVKDWLSSSQNHFSAPISSQSTQEVPETVEQVTSKIQIHTHTQKKKNESPVKIIHVQPPQDDWDKIKILPETNDNSNKNKENIVGPMDIEPFTIDDNEYTTVNPRRSSRRKDIKNHDEESDENNLPMKQIITTTNDQKQSKSKQNWNNVKRMKKEFSRLNKKNKNKLNVSIEMCKKTQSSSNKTINVVPQMNSSHGLYNIDDNTPNIEGNDNFNDCLESNENKITNDDIEDMKINNNDAPKTNDNNLKNTNQSNNNSVNQISNNADENIAMCFDNAAPVNSSKGHGTKVHFFKKGALQSDVAINQNKNTKTKDAFVDLNPIASTDDIEITIKIGNTLTNICIKKKENDVQLKINTDREIQTTLDSNVNNCNIESKDSNLNNVAVGTECIETKTLQITSNKSELPQSTDARKSLSIKKNTATAETVTAQFEITASIERELTKDMGSADNIKHKTQTVLPQIDSKKNSNNIKKTPDFDNLNDLDLFDNESVKEGNVQSLKASKHSTPSEILIPSMKKKLDKLSDKRAREPNSEEDLPNKKKLKVMSEDQGGTSVIQEVIHVEQDSECVNYDVIMNQVFANIDEDMKDIESTSNNKTKKTTTSLTAKNTVLIQSQATYTPHSQIGKIDTNLINALPNIDENHPKDSENIFSVSHIETDDVELIKDMNQDLQKNEKCIDLNTLDEQQFTPFHDNDDSDKSVVEDTPQKSASFSKGKNKNETSMPMNDTPNINKNNINSKFKNTQMDAELMQSTQIKNTRSQNAMSIINLSDSVNTTKTSKNTTIIETTKQKKTLETPLTISKFVTQIKHKSTPVARKSLRFSNDVTEDIDPEQTMCPTPFTLAKTTQEKEFMSKAFERTLSSPSLNRNHKNRNKKLCIAGSCLTSSELANVKILCSENGWSYMDKFTKDLTHLVVGVDQEGKAQRSVKYMCSLASGKWIVSYEWVQKCLQTKEVVDEESYEALDGTGEPGPRRSRITKQKIFQGISFYCMPPFSILDVDTLKDILQSAGGRVVSEAREVRVTGDTPALLLAEPENTQEDRFIYLAMELNIVPVNYEWVLNCLGSYTLGSIQDLLLCPSSLLPPPTARWPSALMAREFDE